MIYLIPSVGDFKAVNEVVVTAGGTLATPQTVRELIIHDEMDVPFTVLAVTAEMLLVMNRFAKQVLKEMPYVVMSVPGAVYDGEWTSLASAFPPMDFHDLARNMSKSGHLANTPEQLQARDVAEGSAADWGHHSSFKGKTTPAIDDDEDSYEDAD